MKEYVIHAKVKNNLLLSRILERHKTVNEFCREHGLSASQVGELINMKTPAVYPETNSRVNAGDWTQAARNLADALACHPSELFTEEQRVAELKTNEAFVEMTRREALALADPEDRLEAKQFALKLLGSAGLNRQERTVINLRFGLGGADGMTLDECGDRLDVTSERIRQIEAKAIRKLKRLAIPSAGGVDPQEIEKSEDGESA